MISEQKSRKKIEKGKSSKTFILPIYLGIEKLNSQVILLSGY